MTKARHFRGKGGQTGSEVYGQVQIPLRREASVVSVKLVTGLFRCYN